MEGGDSDPRDHYGAERHRVRRRHARERDAGAGERHAQRHEPRKLAPVGGVPEQRLNQRGPDRCCEHERSRGRVRVAALLDEEGDERRHRDLAGVGAEVAAGQQREAPAVELGGGRHTERGTERAIKPTLWAPASRAANRSSTATPATQTIRPAASTTGKVRRSARGTLRSVNRSWSVFVPPSPSGRMRSPSRQARTRAEPPSAEAETATSPGADRVASTSQLPKRTCPGIASVTGSGAGAASPARVKRSVPYSATARRPPPRSSDFVPRPPSERISSASRRESGRGPSPAARSASWRSTSPPNAARGPPHSP